ncbi:39S ribosomal protein L38 [Tropilaelaps mercedesae]|uniref:Large ribosomal subunit protein mL38 n=1 Tax=Tropilaelaps mercedesae TaxID=418985 RepID=A0A1V9XFY4_9ACAR|nr:39S ribosomal protein L38 [Tropilaelaps mercedesae]
MNLWDSERDARVDIGFPIPFSSRQRKNDQIERLRKWKELKRSHERLALAKQGKLKLDYDVQKKEWETHDFRKQITCAAEHYRIFQDLYEYGFFHPNTYLKVRYPVSDEEFAPVHMGNIMTASDTSSVPDVTYTAQPGELFTLVMTSLDSHLETTENEYLHWMLTIPGNDLSQATTVCDYMRPIVPKGAGYHRVVFVLYKHMKGQIDLSKERRTPKSVSLRERTFRSLDFYRTHQDDLTPCGLAFFQCKWDNSLVDFYHNTLGMKVPVFEHIPLKPEKQKFKKYPEGESFNEYIDLFRDPKEIAEEIYCRRLKSLNPFEEESPEKKYPHAQPFPRGAPSWQKTEISRERAKMGKYRHMRRFSLWEQTEQTYVQPYDRYGPRE